MWGGAWSGGVRVGGRRGEGVLTRGSVEERDFETNDMK